MPHVGDQIAEWMAAYRVLGVPLSATALTIKQTYRKLMKRWHPDLLRAEVSTGGRRKDVEAD